MRATDSRVPTPERPYGWKPYTRRSMTTSATYAGSSLLTCSADSVWLPLPFDLVRGERRIPHDIGEQARGQLEAVLHDGDIRRSTGRRPVPDVELAADRVDRLGDLLRRARGRPLVEQRRRQGRDAALRGRILRGAGPHDQAQADRRLLVVHYDHHRQPVGQAS